MSYFAHNMQLERLVRTMYAYYIISEYKVGVVTDNKYTVP